MSDFLTHEAELLISDRLYHRRLVQDELDAVAEETGEAPAPTPIQKRSLRDGDEAAARLVLAYDPFVMALAHGVLRHRYNRGSVIEVADLAQVGRYTMLKATRRYDARGASRTPCEEAGCEAVHAVRCFDDSCSGDRMESRRCRHQRCNHERLGMRFATYCKLYVLREMNRTVHAASTGVTLNVDVIKATWMWVEATAKLKESLGREPTVGELEAETGVSADYIELNLPSRVGMVDVDTVDVSDATSAIEDGVQALMDAATFNGVLETALGEVFIDEMVNVFMASIGADLGVPRSTKETAELLGMGVREVKEYEDTINNALRHPQNRVRIRRALLTLQAAGAEI